MKFGIMLATLIASLMFVQGAQAYMHADNCKAGLRSGGPGDRQHDDDIHLYGVLTGATSAWFNGIEFHPNGLADHVVVYVRFQYSGGAGVYDEPGYCLGSDSSFTDNIRYAPAGW